MKKKKERGARTGIHRVGGIEVVTRARRPNFWCVREIAGFEETWIQGGLWNSAGRLIARTDEDIELSELSDLPRMSAADFGCPLIKPDLARCGKLITERIRATSSFEASDKKKPIKVAQCGGGQTKDALGRIMSVKHFDTVYRRRGTGIIGKHENRIKQSRKWGWCCSSPERES